MQQHQQMQEHLLSNGVQHSRVEQQWTHLQQNLQAPHSNGTIWMHQPNIQNTQAIATMNPIQTAPITTVTTLAPVATVTPVQTFQVPVMMQEVQAVQAVQAPPIRCAVSPRTRPFFTLTFEISERLNFGRYLCLWTEFKRCKSTP